MTSLYVETPEIWALEFLENDKNSKDVAGLWVSSLTQSWQKGYPDNCSMPWSVYLDMVRRFRLNTDRKIVVDVDMMYNEPGIASIMSKELSAAGANTLVIESKTFPKVNSLFPTDVRLSTTAEFCRLLNRVKMNSPELEILARIEHLSVNQDPNEVLEVALAAQDAGADGVVIHWGYPDTDLLYTTLKQIHEKTSNLKVGIIPTKFMGDFNEGKFSEFIDFAILGNICSSYLRTQFEGLSLRDDLMQNKVNFKPILSRSKGYETPKGKTLVVLGGKSSKLNDPQILSSWTKLSEHYHKVLMVADTTDGMDLGQLPANCDVLTIDASQGEVDTLAVAEAHIRTDQVVVAYAGLEDRWFDLLEGAINPGMYFDKDDDKFLGILSVECHYLAKLIENATDTMLEAGGSIGCKIVTCEPK
jgi:hypothetical protein